MSDAAKGTVFVSYAHDDIARAPVNWVDVLRPHLVPVKRAYGLEIWSDHRIRLGEQWNGEIEAALGKTDVGILLVGPSFLASDYIVEREMPALLRRREEAGALLLPVVVSACAVSDTPFHFPDPALGPKKLCISDLQMASSPTQPLAALMDRVAYDEILLAVASRVREFFAERAARAGVPRAASVAPPAAVLPTGRRWVVVAGTGRAFLTRDAQEDAADTIGRRLAEAGYGLVSGGWPGIDAISARAFAEVLGQRGESVDERLVQIVMEKRTPEFDAGRIVRVPEGAREWVEQIVRADAVVLIGGIGGTWTSGELGYAYGKAVLPLAGTGGDAKKFHERFLARWDEYPISGITKDAFERLARPVPDVIEDVMAALAALPPGPRT
jgi:hypothetical protein